jgi:murein DD-endopeptidase MepM/ murein hydrolase activator NlpD
MLLVGTATALSVALLGVGSGAASADGVTPTVTLPPLPTVSVPPLPPPPAPPAGSGPVAVPAPNTPAAPTTGADGGGGTGGGSAGGGSAGGGAAGSGLGGTPAGAPAGGVPAAGADGAAARAAEARGNKATAGKPIGPMVAGRPEAADVVDDESAPAVYEATKAFLRADQRIAVLARLRDTIAGAQTGAARAAASYRSLGVDAAAAREQARALHARHGLLQRTILNDVRTSYQTGRLATDDQSIRALAAAARRADDAAARADLRVSELLAAQQQARTGFERYAATYHQAKDRLAGINRRLEALAAQRAAALTAARDAAGADLARHRQGILESGRLGAAIRAASADLAASGHTVQGTGQFVRPSSGVVTSPYGMRFHPILHYTKLHTGTDFAVGDGMARAADDGRVLFTIVSEAYGNFTVIDHGTIDGRHITTAYAHQARFLVQPGEVVRKGQVIGAIGSTGWATGPHLHFEVRDDGAVQDPMTWLD